MRQIVYCQWASEFEKCSLGCGHEVTYFLVKHIMLAEEEFFQEYVTHLHYTHGGIATFQVAYDHQGRKYIRNETWDSPTPWRREDGMVFTSHKTKVAKDIFGNLL